VCAPLSAFPFLGDFLQMVTALKVGNSVNGKIFVHKLATTVKKDR